MALVMRLKVDRQSILITIARYLESESEAAAEATDTMAFPVGNDKYRVDDGPYIEIGRHYRRITTMA